MMPEPSVELAAKLHHQELGGILDEFGIEKTWKSIIVTHIQKTKPRFVDSISRSDEFSDAEILGHDFIAGLTLGETSILYEFSLSHTNRTSRKNEGQYFTPDDVAMFLAEKSLTFPTGIWLDACSGIGNLSHWLTSLQANPEEFIMNKLLLLDRDPLALLIARALFAIHFEDKETNLFGKIKDNFIPMDLLGTTELPSHDFAIINPPYVGTPADERFASVKARDLYAYCVERIAISSKGFISITPQSFTNSTKFSGFRKMLMDQFKSFDIYCFDNMPDTIFRGIKFGSVNTNMVNSTRASVIVANPASKEGHRITPLLRWKTGQRSALLNKAPDFLTPFNPTPEIFPKLNQGLSALYQEMAADANGYKPLSLYLSAQPTKYQLIIPATPRYFISAVRRSLNRTSFRTVFFRNQEDADKAYLILNSSLMYWWWTVNDGGMTISQSTLATLPIPDRMIIDKDLISRLEQSEQDNLVIKMNAGKPIENVKHSWNLVNDINNHIYPSLTSGLLQTHGNSHIS